MIFFNTFVKSLFMKHLFKKQILFPLFLIAGILLQFSNAQAQFKFRDFTAYPAIPYYFSPHYLKIDSTTFASVCKTTAPYSDYGLYIGDVNGNVISYSTFPLTNSYNNSGNFTGKLTRDDFGNFYCTFLATGQSWLTNGPVGKHTYIKTDPNGNILNRDSFFIHGSTDINQVFMPTGNWVIAMNHLIYYDNSNSGNLVTDSMGIRVLNTNLSIDQDIIYPNCYQGAPLISKCVTVDSFGNYYLVIDSTITVNDTDNLQEYRRPISFRLVKFTSNGQMLWDQQFVDFSNLTNVNCPSISQIRIIDDKIVLSGLTVDNLDYTSLSPIGVANFFAICFDTSGTLLNRFTDIDDFADPFVPSTYAVNDPLSILDTTSAGNLIFYCNFSDYINTIGAPQPKIIEWNPISGIVNWEFDPFLFQNSLIYSLYYNIRLFKKNNGNLIAIGSQCGDYDNFITTVEIDQNGNVVYQDSVPFNYPFTILRGEWFEESTGESFALAAGQAPYVQGHYPCRLTWCDSCTANIEGTAYLDMDSTCSLNTNFDIPLYFRPIEIDNTQTYSFTDFYGNYLLSLSTGNHDLEISLPQPNYFYWNCMTNPITVNAPIQPNVSIGNDFSVSLLPNVHDIYSETFTTSGHDNPGNILEFHAYVKNIGTVAETGILEFTYTDSVFSFYSANPSPDSISTGYLAWNYQNLAIFDMNHYHIELYIPTTVSIGSPFLISTTAGDLLIDTFPNNNSSSFPDTIGGPFDPNDKQVNPQGIGSDGFITTLDSLLKYTVRFQNTGTDTAINVRIEDIIDTDLDLSTIQFDFYTHNFTPLIYGRKLVLKFDNIFLPDSGADYNGSMGMIQYSIKQNPSLNPGTRIENYAAIYFDYNAPIFTNTTVNTITYPVNVIDSNPNKVSQIMVYPNPIEESVWLKWDFSTEDNFQSAEIYSLTGQSLVNLNDLFSGKPTGISDISSRCTVLGSGIYLLQIKFENRTKTIKIVSF
jgi:uncharacterized repeat protein (TIGR01451 family)